MKGEYHENTDRKDFTNSEGVAISRAVEPAIRQEVQANKGGRPKKEDKTPSNLDEVSVGQRTDEAVAKVTGKKRSNLRKGRAIVEAAEEEPDKFKDISDKVDSGEISVDKG